MEVRSVEDLLAVEREIGQFEAIRHRCQFQIQQKLFPSACLQEIRHRLVEPPVPKAPSVALLWDEVRNLCRLGADNIQSIYEIRSLMIKEMPRLCNLALKRRLLDLEYLENKRGTLFENHDGHENADPAQSAL